MNGRLHICVLAAGLLMCLSCVPQPSVRLGADIFIENNLDLAKAKRVGLVANQASRLSSGQLLLDALIAKEVSVVALFSPEHGIRGEAAAGESVLPGIDEKTGIRVHSLYGNTKKPTTEMLANVDVLLYDLQDVGARYYTYISTMALAMEAAAEQGIPFVVLDRPNPLGVIMVDGPVIEDSLRSFVGMLPIPVVYGLTCGELARMINGEHWLRDGIQADLTVVQLEGWGREMVWSETGLPWTRPSPNIPTPETALVYPATCFIEATNVSEGRGTDRPFNMIGAPFIDGKELARALTNLQLPGVSFSPVDFIPASSKFQGQQCHGVRIEVTEPSSFQPIRTGLSLLQEIRKLYGEWFVVDAGVLSRLVGVAGIDDLLMRQPAVEIEQTWRKELVDFKSLSSSYWTYPKKVH